MPEFTSKLQYKNYEKGEYTGEQARNLEDTLKLIKTFPWDEQRGSDVQPTGPSVTILDDNGNYLKVGLYFGGKFCLYYFDRDHHLYESHAETYDDIAAVVTDFFNGRIDLARFERDRLVLDAAKHFENGAFDYQVAAWKIYGRLALLVFLTFIMIGDGMIILFVSAPLAVKVLLPAFILFFVGMAVYSQYLAWLYYRRCKNMYLELSTGRAQFSFCEDGDILEYSKDDISEINVYGPLSGKTTPILTLCVLVFANGNKITLPGLLIPPLDVLSKFRGIKANQFTRRSEYLSTRLAFAHGN